MTPRPGRQLADARLRACAQKLYNEEQRRTLQEQLDAKRERVSVMEARRAQLVQLLALRRKSVQHQDDLMQARSPTGDTSTGLGLPLLVLPLPSGPARCSRAAVRCHALGITRRSAPALPCRRPSGAPPTQAFWSCRRSWATCRPPLRSLCGLPAPARLPRPPRCLPQVAAACMMRH